MKENKRIGESQGQQSGNEMIRIVKASLPTPYKNKRGDKLWG